MTLKSAPRWTDGLDYQLAYENNTNAGTAAVTVTGKGNYTGAVTLEFAVTPLNLEAGGTLRISDEWLIQWNGKPWTPEVFVTLGTAELKAGTDFTAAYTDNTEPGEAAVTVTGKGNYTGTLTGSFPILPVQISGVQMQLAYGSHEYTGAPLTPEILITDKEHPDLKAGTDYTAEYAKNTEPGAASVTVTGKGHFTGTVTLGFSIVPADITASAELVPAYTDIRFDGREAYEPEITVLLGGRTIPPDDYTVTYRGNKAAGDAAACVKFRNHYTGETEVPFTISPADLAKDLLLAEPGAAVYDGKAQRPAVSITLKSGYALDPAADFTADYKDNISAGTGTVIVTGKGNVTGTLEIPFAIAPADLKSCKAVITDPMPVTETGGEICPSAAVQFGETPLTAGTDYKVSYSGNIKPGTAVMQLEGTGNFTGLLTLPFEILPHETTTTTTTTTTTNTTTTTTTTTVTTTTEATTTTTTAESETTPTETTSTTAEMTTTVTETTTAAEITTTTTEATTTIPDITTTAIEITTATTEMTTTTPEITTATTEAMTSTAEITTTTTEITTATEVITTTTEEMTTTIPEITTTTEATTTTAEITATTTEATTSTTKMTTTTPEITTTTTEATTTAAEITTTTAEETTLTESADTSVIPMPESARFDLDGSGTPDIADAVLLCRLITEGADSVQLAGNPDFDGDGLVTLLDLVLLLNDLNK